MEVSPNARLIGLIKNGGIKDTPYVRIQVKPKLTFVGDSLVKYSGIGRMTRANVNNKKGLFSVAGTIVWPPMSNKDFTITISNDSISVSVYDRIKISDFKLYYSAKFTVILDLFASMYEAEQSVQEARAPTPALTNIFNRTPAATPAPERSGMISLTPNQYESPVMRAPALAPRMGDIGIRSSLSSPPPSPTAVGTDDRFVIHKPSGQK